METYTAEPETIQRDWFVIDAAGQALGRLTTEVVRRLRGRHKPECTPHVDTGDYIVVVNTEQMHVTSAKTADKMYYHHSGFPGGIKSISFGKLIAKAPERVVETAVKGMLPESPPGRGMYHKLKVYKSVSHPHTAQRPQELKV